MSTSEERGRLAEGVTLTHEAQIELAQTLEEKGYSNASIAHIMRIDESTVDTLVKTPLNKIDWSQNCLTGNVHNGRSEAIWNIPLLYAATMIFSREALKEIVISRIYNDAMMFVDHAGDNYTQKWADRLKDIAEESYYRTLQHKVDELSTYYEKPLFKQEQLEIAERVTTDNLNPHYAPLHGHDSINMLCRILGVSSLTRASK